MSSKARVAVIGTGWWATSVHIPGLQNNPDAELVALCDNDPHKLQAAAEAAGINHTYTDYRALLAGETLDGVVVVSANATHYEIVKACLAQDLHVMVEKPMTLYAPEARELVELAQGRQRELIVGYPFNYTPLAIRLRDLVQSGHLGRVQYVNCIYNSYMAPFFTGTLQMDFAVHGPGQYTQPEQSGGGHGHVQITHAAGYMFFITGLRPRRVHALAAQHGLPVELIQVMTVEFEGGAIGSVNGSGNWNGLKFSLQIGCERGWLDINPRDGVATIRREAEPPEEIKPDPEAEPVYPQSATANNLVEVILGQAGNGSPAEVGWRTVELLDAAYRSAALDGRAVTIKALYA
jgi:predicted dehydrogenase